MIYDIAGASNSNAFCGVAYVTAYYASRNDTVWADLDLEVQEAAIVKATAYLDSKYRWRGYRVTSLQALSWPRSGVELDGFLLDASVVPVRIKDATAELAYRVATGTELVSDVKPGGSVVEQTVDVITTKYSERATSQTSYSYVEQLLAPLVGVSSNAIRLVRA